MSRMGIVGKERHDHAARAGFTVSDKVGRDGISVIDKLILDGRAARERLITVEMMLDDECLGLTIITIRY